MAATAIDEPVFLTTAMQQSLHYCAARSRNCGQSASTTSEGYSAIATGTIALGLHW
jgi:hypothetical protein